MAPIIAVIVAIVALAVGAVTASLIQRTLQAGKLRVAQEQAKKTLQAAEAKHAELLKEAKEEANKVRGAAETEYRERRAELHRNERRLAQKEDNLDRKLDNLERRDRNLQVKEKEIEALRGQVEEIRKKQITELERVSGLTTEEAKAQLLKSLEAELEHEAAKKIYEVEQRIKEEAEVKAHKAVALAIQRLDTDVVSETTVTVVPIPSDDMKGRLIGREGRNIRALEAATGVDLIIDDTPEAVTLSSFDPIRRETARVALNKLMLDGRIQPARIEEMVEKARQEVDESIRKAGQEAILEVGVMGLNQELVSLLGRLKYRYSYGQNVLKHSIEVAHLCGMIGSEVGAKVQICKTAGLLHDIGKALSHEMEGGHAEIGGEIARKYGIPADISMAIEEHHSDDRVNLEAFIVAAADAISGARPGARRDTVENYIRRLEALEQVANGFDGVERSFAIQAGREVRIMVKPDKIDDMAAAKLAHDVVKKIQETLVYPGQIKVTVIRETRNVDYAK